MRTNRNSGSPDPTIGRLIRRVLLGCGLLIASVVLLGLLAEAGFRVLKASIGTPYIHQDDDRIGWVPTPNFHYDFQKQTPDGKTYLVHYATNEFGFRFWGDPKSGRPRIFFVGDSFTQDSNMSNESAYFSQVAKTLPVEVFAIGGGGYSTLQEMLMLERYWPVIKPTHVVVQFCSDFENNDYDTETFLIVRNQKNQRPYLRNGEIVFRDASLYRFFTNKSYLFRSLDQRLQNLQYAWWGGYMRPDDAERSRQFHAEAVEVTRRILSMMRHLGSRATRWFMFSCDASDMEWVDLAVEAGFQPILGVDDAVAVAQARGLAVRGGDGSHWNDLGHEIAGRVIAQFLARQLEAGASPGEPSLAQMARATGSARQGLGSAQAEPGRPPSRAEP